MTRPTAAARTGLAAALTVASLTAGAAVMLLAADARVLGAQAASTNPWSIGFDASLSSQRSFIDGQRSPRQNLLAVPGGEARLGYRVSPMLQLEVPFAFSLIDTKEFSAQGGTIGLDANVFFAPGSSARPFIGAGGFVTYTHSRLATDIVFTSGGLGSYEGSTNEHASNVGLVGRLGADLRATPSFSVRPSLFYRHRFEKTNESVGFDELGAALGGTIHFGPQGPASGTPSRVQVSYGAELAHTSYGSPAVSDALFLGFVPPDQTTLEAPRAVIGLLVPVTRAGRTSLGANVALARIGADGGSISSLTLQPRVEFNANRDWRTRPSVRLGVQGDWQYDHYANGMDSGSRSQGGAGADLSATFPTGRGVLSRVGLGYDYLAKNSGKALASQSRVSLRFGFDAI